MLRVGSPVLHQLNVSDLIVEVPLDVPPEGLTIVRVWDAGAANARGIVVGVRDRSSTRLAKMLSASGLDQPKEGVVSVVSAGLNSGVGKKDRLLSSIADVGNVAGDIEGVVEVLKKPSWARFLRVQVNETKGLKVIGVASRNAVRVVDFLSLSFGIVVDVRHAHWRRGDGSGVDERARHAPVIEPHVDVLEQVRVVVAGLDDIDVRPCLVAMGGY